MNVKEKRASSVRQEAGERGEELQSEADKPEGELGKPMKKLIGCCTESNL